MGERAEYDQLLDALIIDLMNFLDPRTQARVVSSVYKRSEIYNGPFFDEAADLQVGFESGYRTSWQTALGGAPPRVIEPNMKKGSGDHGSFDYKSTAGVLITNRPPTSGVTRIIDIAPTVLKYFGLAIPAELDGKSFF